MFGSQMLEVAIGLTFFYVLFSVISSAVKELIAGVFSWRAKMLKLAVRNLLQDPTGEGLTSQIFSHPLITRFAKPGTAGRIPSHTPSYIPSQAFALALLDSIAPASADGRQPQSLANIREAVVKMDNQNLKQVLLPLLDQAGQNVDQAFSNIEHWFDSTMERASGWYKRQAQVVILGIALVSTVLLNVDTIAICNALWQEQALRDSMVAIATEQVRQSNVPSSAQAVPSVDQLLEQKLQLPLGWHKGNLAAQGWFIKILGLLLTTVAVSLGAPFWFDLLNKLVNLRAAGQPPPRPAAAPPPPTQQPPPPA